MRQMAQGTETCLRGWGGGVTKASGSQGRPTAHVYYFGGLCLSTGVQIRLLPWTCLLPEPTVHIALCPQSNGAKKRKVEKEGMICLPGK